MQPPFLTSVWCELPWTDFVPFSRRSSRDFPSGPGMYRVRVAGAERLAYVGETGRSLRERLTALRSRTLAAEMPFNDPHTAAPRLWSYRTADGLEYEASAAGISLSKKDRKSLESFLVWSYRREAGTSTLCNFGRMHPLYTASRNRSTGVRGRLLEAGEQGTVYGASVPALQLFGTPGANDWMGLTWSPPAPLAARSLAPLSGRRGVYVVSVEPGGVIYIGESGNLAQRLYQHASRAWGAEPQYRFCELPDHTGTQRLEVENDLIAGYYAQHRKAPAGQFGEDDSAPAE